MVNGTPDWDGYYLSAYGIAVKHGFQGSEEEWLASLGLPARVAAELANTAAASANTAAAAANTAAELANEAATAANTAAQGVEDVIDGAIESFSEQAQQAVAAAEAAESAATSAKNSVEEALVVAEEVGAKGELAQTAAAAAQAAAQNANEKAQAAVEAADDLSTVKAATEAAITVADAAATAANTAAAAANASKTAADEAASAANAAATSAQTQGNYAKSQGDRAAALIEIIQDADVGSLAADILDLQDSITALEAGKLDKSGGALTGNLTAEEITGTKLQTTGAEKLSEAAQKVAVLDEAGWISYRTPEEILEDIGAQEKTGYESFSIPATGWTAGTATDNNSYPNYVDIEMPGLTSRDQVTIYLAPASLYKAKACGLCPTVNVYNDELRIRAKRIPAANIPAQLWIEKGL